MLTMLEPSHRNYEIHAAKQRGLPVFKPPHIVACFSIDADRKCFPNDRSQLFFVRPCPASDDPVHLNLGDGYENVIKKTKTGRYGEKLDTLLSVIVDDFSKYRNIEFEQKVLRADVVCWRGLLRQIMITPFEEKVGLNVLATRFKGTVYLIAWKSDKQVALEDEQDTPELRRISSYGFKFEQYQQRKNRTQEPDTSLPINENEEFGCVFEGDLDGMHLLYGAEMDGIEEKPDVDLETVDLNSVRFVELKVNLRPQRANQIRNFYKYKVGKWWTQCFLAGVEQMQVGTRTNAGVVDDIYNVNINALVKTSHVS